MAALCKVVSLDLKHLMATLPSSWGDPSLTCSSLVFVQLEHLQLSSGVGLLHDVTLEPHYPALKHSASQRFPLPSEEEPAAPCRAIISPAIPSSPVELKSCLSVTEKGLACKAGTGLSSAASIPGLRAGKTRNWGRGSRPSVGKMVTVLFLMTPYKCSCQIGKALLAPSSKSQPGASLERGPDKLCALLGSVYTDCLQAGLMLRSQLERAWADFQFRF